MSKRGSDGDLICWGLRCLVRNVLVLPPPSWFIPLSPFVVQEPEPDDSGPGEVSSWDVNTDRPTSTVGKLSKAESQNHMSPRYSADLHIWKHADKIVSLCFYKSYLTCTSGSLRHLGLTQKCFWKFKRFVFFFSLLQTCLSFVLILTHSTVKWRTGCRDVLVAPPWKTDRTPRPRATEPAAWRASALQTRDWLHR